MQRSLFTSVINSMQPLQYVLENNKLEFCFLYNRGRKLYLKHKLYEITGQSKEDLNDWLKKKKIVGWIIV